ncbi:cyclase family protein [Bowmanella sp. JS7-9]|uniref:Cyclase family protein n=1 Tax=Pseudobowmanella zhangzhouensis TaxID=1537679 RepID=A0ABW1XNK3_9ALTE|nr:cyclase family protein [Bowmanella sp. JS7-9]TBX24440.1 cyclase [Bowmanella sp. JS7-9]
MHTRLIDLSHEIFDGLITYKGLPAPVICDFLSREQSKANYGGQHSVQIGRINMVSNTGTYVDVPFHFCEHGEDLAQLELSHFAELPGICIDAHGVQAIGPELFAGKALRGRAVLIHTGWSQHWNTPVYFENHPFLTEAAAGYLQQAGVMLVGIDSHNIDDTRGVTRPVHQHLLSHRILIVEHLTNLASLPQQDFLFSAVPPKVAGMGTFPVRAYASLTAKG